MLNWTTRWLRRNKANFPRAESDGADRQAPRTERRWDSSCETKPICTRQLRKQTQSPGGYPMVPSFQYSDPELAVQTKPISRKGPGANALRRHYQSGVKRTNEANFPVWTAKAGAVRLAELPWDEACETKPISRTMNANRLVERGLRQPTRSLTCAKQRQFPSRGKEKTPAGAGHSQERHAPEWHKERG